MTTANPSASHEYINRAYYGRNDVDILATAFKMKQNSLLLGPAGTGKSSLVEQAAAKLGLPYSYIPCHTGATAEAILGQFVPNPAGTGYVWMDGLLTHAVRHGGLILLDEVNSLLPEVAFCLHGLLDHRRELILTDKPGPTGGPEVIKAHENFGLVAAGNPDYEGVRPMNEAFRDRFACQLKMGYIWKLDVNIVQRLPAWESLDEYQRTAIQSFIEKVRNASENNGTIYSDVSSRAFIDFVNNIQFQGFRVARTIFSTRFSDDSQEQSAIRTIFRDIWDDNGNVNNAPRSAPRRTQNSGQAGGFAAQANQATQQAAGQTF